MAAVLQRFLEVIDPRRGFADVPAEARERAVDATIDQIAGRTPFASFAYALAAVAVRMAPVESPVHTRLFDAAVAAMFLLALLRVVTRNVALRQTGRDTRMALLAGPLLAQIAVWTAFSTVAIAVLPETFLPMLLAFTQAMAAAAAVLTYGSVAWLAGAMCLTLLAPTVVVLLVTSPADQPEWTLAVITTIFLVLLLSVLPRLQRERWSGAVSVFLLEARARSLEEAREALRRAAAAKDAFQANLSHEIRTPLHGLLGIVEQLHRTELDGDQRRALTQLDSCGQSLLRVVNDALDVLRIEAGAFQVRKEPFTVAVLLTDVVALFSPEAVKKDVTLELRSRGLEVVALGDPSRLRQILGNLVGNAVKFTPAGGRVDVDAHTDPTAAGIELVVRVQDTGVGFDARESARLFQRFSQLDEGARAGGAGLGLAISKELVALMGGEIEASSAGPGRGASFVVRVPLERAAQGPVSGKKVLVVDDNPVNLAVARTYLRQLGCDVIEASGGRAAVELAVATPMDAILMDVQMPDLDGFQATRDLRARGIRTPILALTAHDDPGTDERWRAAGMNGIVVKPVSPEGLRATLAGVFAEHEAQGTRASILTTT